VPETDIAIILWGREQECPLGAQLPISASVVRRYDVVVGCDVGIDRLVANLKDTPNAAANGHRPAIIIIVSADYN
jgi:hypothetical protein